MLCRRWTEWSSVWSAGIDCIPSMDWRRCDLGPCWTNLIWFGFGVGLVQGHGLGLHKFALRSGLYFFCIFWIFFWKVAFFSKGLGLVEQLGEKIGLWISDRVDKVLWCGLWVFCIFICAKEAVCYLREWVKRGNTFFFNGVLIVALAEVVAGHKEHSTDQIGGRDSGCSWNLSENQSNYK